MKTREFELKKTVELDLDNIPKWLQDELFDAVFGSMLFTFHDEGKFHIHGQCNGNSVAEFDLFLEVSEEVERCLEFKSAGQCEDSLEMLSGLQSALTKSLKAVNDAIAEIKPQRTS